VDSPPTHPRRQQRANQTRQDILTAARTLFVANGYTATTVNEIASEAGVAVQTVYSSVGPKAQVLVALLDQIRTDAKIRGIATVEFDDPWEVLVSGARTRRAIIEAGADVIRLLADNAANEPDVGRAWATLLEQAHAGVEIAMGLLAEHGALRPDLTPSEAADRVSTLLHPVGILYLIDRGWTLDQVESMLLDTLRRTVTTLDPPA
jgi:AcrR family transcriptional regulator